MFIVVNDETDMDQLRSMPLRYRRVVEEMIHQVDARCDDIICIIRVEKDNNDFILQCKTLAKSGTIGTQRVCEIINEIFEYDPENVTIPVADPHGSSWTVRIGSKTHDLNKNYRRSYNA